ncbi:hypothetical protein ACFL46_00230 [Candidatus Neomarinimicrobiota bacterium]
MAVKRINLKEHLGNKYISVVSLERPTPETMNKTNNEVEKLLKENNCNKVLVDTTPIKYLPSLTGVYNLGVDTAGLDTIRSGRMAFIVSEKTTELVKFLSTVAHNRGLNISLFTNKDDAKDWLFS